MGKENMRTSMARALRLINISLYIFVILLTKWSSLAIYGGVAPLCGDLAIAL